MLLGLQPSALSLEAEREDQQRATGWQELQPTVDHEGQNYHEMKSRQEQTQSNQKPGGQKER